MKFWRRYLALGLVTYLLFVVSQLPANNIYYFTKDLLKGQGVTLYGVQGSLWSGSADVATYNELHFKQVAWELHPLALLTANLSASVRFKQNDNSVQAVISRSFFDGLTVENGQIRMDAAQLIKLAKIPAVKLNGQFSLNLPLLELADKKVEYIKGRLVWADAESVFPQKMVMGDIFADMSTSEDGTIHVKLGDGGGPLEMDANLLLTADGKYDFKGLFSAREGRNSSLGRTLGFMGRYQDGKVAFNKAGEISEFSFLF